MSPMKYTRSVALSAKPVERYLAKESLDGVVAAKLAGLADFEVAPMPPAADLMATPEALAFTCPATASGW